MQREQLTVKQMKESGFHYIRISSEELAMPYMKNIKKLIRRRYNLKMSVTSEIIYITEIIHDVRKIEAEHENRYLIKYKIEHISDN